MNDMGLDSLDHVEVIMAVEDEFGNDSAHNDYILNFLTVRSSWTTVRQNFRKCDT